MKTQFPTQTKFVAVAYVILLVSIFVPFDMNENIEVGANSSYGLKKRVVVFLLMLFPITVSIYTINCLVVGNCEIWAWYNAILVMIWCCGVFMTAVTNIKTSSLRS